MDPVGSNSDDLGLLENVHLGLPNPTEDGETYLVKGSYKYYHYGCDTVEDKGWGCGYRTLQTLCSWVKNCVDDSVKVPTIHKIQKVLVDIEDKPNSFIGSREWIGSVEVGLVIDQLYDVSCKILHIQKGQLKDYINDLVQHFTELGSPVMMGGDQDCSSKGIMGVHVSSNATFLLIVDPHFIGSARFIGKLQHNSWIVWKNIHELLDSSFYNLCLPQLKYKD